MEQVILRVGDVLTRYRANSECLEHKIIEITNGGYVYKQCTPHARVRFHECEHWFVNGKKYHRDNIIIPNHGGEANKMIDHIPEVTKMVDDFEVGTTVELNGVRGKVVKCEDPEFKAFMFDKPVARNKGLSAKQWIINKNNLGDVKVVDEIVNQLAQPHYEIDHTVEDNEMVEITPENIKEVLEYNNIEPSLYHIDKNNITCYSRQNDSLHNNNFEFTSSFWLQLVEVYFGKLKPLPKPQFDFEEYINEHIPKEKGRYLERMWTRVANGQRPMFPCTKENADVLIEMVKLSEELEYEEV